MKKDSIIDKRINIAFLIGIILPALIIIGKYSYGYGYLKKFNISPTTLYANTVNFWDFSITLVIMLIVFVFVLIIYIFSKYVSRHSLSLFTKLYPSLGFDSKKYIGVFIQSSIITMSFCSLIFLYYFFAKSSYSREVINALNILAILPLASILVSSIVAICVVILSYRGIPVLINFFKKEKKASGDKEKKNGKIKKYKKYFIGVILNVCLIFLTVIISIIFYRLLTKISTGLISNIISQEILKSSFRFILTIYVSAWLIATYLCLTMSFLTNSSKKELDSTSKKEVNTMSNQENKSNNINDTKFIKYFYILVFPLVCVVIFGIFSSIGTQTATNKLSNISSMFSITEVIQFNKEDNQNLSEIKNNNDTLHYMIISYNSTTALVRQIECDDDFTCRIDLEKPYKYVNIVDKEIYSKKIKWID